MNRKILIPTLLFMLVSALRSQGQSTFQNLNFEQANPVYDTGSPYYPSYPLVTAASALPGWTVTYSGPVVQGTDLWWNEYTAGSAAVEIFGPNNPATSFRPGAIDGHYSVFLEGGFRTPTALVSASITQTGMVPVGSESLQFEVWQSLPPNSAVSFDGNILSPVVLGTGADYTLYGVDITPYAGVTGQLEFTSTLPQSSLTLFGLDDISFSVAAVPEPNSLILAGTGGLVFALHRRFRQR